MKRLFTLLLISGIIYLSSCGDGGNDKLPAIVQPDSLSKGDSLFFNYASASGSAKSFVINDYSINNSPYYEMYASVTYNKTDSLWHCKLQLIDNKLKRFALKLSLVSPTQTGTFTFPDNSSTFIDYTEGDNTTYEVAQAGSSVNITQATYPIRGDISLVLYRNFKTMNGYGNFKIYP